MTFSRKESQYQCDCENRVDRLEQICVCSLGVIFPIIRPNSGYLHFCGVDRGYGDDVKEDMLEDVVIYRK